MAARSVVKSSTSRTLLANVISATGSPGPRLSTKARAASLALAMGAPSMLVLVSITSTYEMGRSASTTLVTLTISARSASSPTRVKSAFVRPVMGWPKGSRTLAVTRTSGSSVGFTPVISNCPVGPVSCVKAMAAGTKLNSSSAATSSSGLIFTPPPPECVMFRSIVTTCTRLLIIT